MKKSQLKQIIKEEISKILKEGSVGNYFANGEGPYLDNKNRRPLKNTDHAKHYVHHNSDVSTVSKLQEEDENEITVGYDIDNNGYSIKNTQGSISGELFRHFFIGVRPHNANNSVFLQNYIKALGSEIQHANGLLQKVNTGNSNVTGVNL